MKIWKRTVSLLLTVSLLVLTAAPHAQASSAAGSGKYVSDVFIAYGKTEDEAKKWLTDNGWEPLSGNSNVGLGKASAFDKEIAVVMGIRRADKASEALTDMAVMNMTGGYSFPDYEKLIREKKTEIDEFINNFIPAIKEFRDNYAGKGSAFGKKRADFAYRMLNRFYDGGGDDPYAVADTGMHLGELFLGTLRQEMTESAYNALSDEQKKTHGDLQQIILESCGPVVLLMEQMLAIGADSGQESWLQRLGALSGDGLLENLEKYAPETAGQDLAPSAATQVLRQHFGDAAEILAAQWAEIRAEMRWVETYCDQNDLWPHMNEPDAEYIARVNKFFRDLEKKDAERFDEEIDRFYNDIILYDNLYSFDYRGEWGATLGDFFNPFNNKDYGSDSDLFLPFAAALSEGQRATLEMLSLNALLNVGCMDEEALNSALPDIEEVFGDTPELSVYSGMNRGIFRYGVALTSEALMEENMGKGRAFDRLFDNAGVMAVTAYAAAAAGAVSMIAGAFMVANGTMKIIITELSEAARKAMIDVRYWTQQIKYGEEAMKSGYNMATELEEYRENLAAAQKILDKENPTVVTRMGTAGRWMLGIGGALMVGAAIVKAVQLAVYYNRTFTMIPKMIVDEADIVTYKVDEQGNQIKDENGNPVKIIEFDQFVYYDAVKCNRQQVGKISDWQKGVSDYVKDGCGDVADLNGDCGQEWLALYTNRSPKKGDPILADSLTVQYGSDVAPKDTEKALHFFTYTAPADLGDTAYSFNNDKGGIYVFWKGDAAAGDAARSQPNTATAFSMGQLALSGAGGLLIGILGATLVLMPRKKKEEEAAK